MRWVIFRLLLGILAVLFLPSVYAEPLDMDQLLPQEERAGAAKPSTDDENADEANPPPAAQAPTTTPAAPANPDSSLAPPVTPAAAPTPTTKTTGDVLVMPPPAKSVNITLPGRGMKKDDVEKRFGAPIEKIDAVGKPPISRWVYKDFTVFFEGDYVLHAALKEP